jgi:hypothetical protein
MTGVRRAVVWIVALPLTAAATLAAHSLAYRLAVPDAGARDTLLAATGHGYEDWVPLFLALSTAAAVAATASAARELGERTPRPAAWPFLLLPPFAFTAQEHLERLLAEGRVPWTAVVERTFLPGLLLTVPFGMAAYLAARLLLRVASSVARALAPPRLQLVATIAARPSASIDVVPVSVLASRHPTRGPPHVG